MQRFGYVDTPRGQMHFRAAGQGAPFVLLHWAPGSSAQYAAVVEAFAAAGLRGIAPDLPGFGASCRREGHWSIGDFADAVLAFLDAMDVRRCVLVGGHISSEIAMEAALRAPRRFVYVGLDGTPTWDEELRRTILSKAMPAKAEPTEDGSHMAALWKHILWEARMWRPNVPFDSGFAKFAMNLLQARMMAGFDMRPARALLEYDAVEALRRLEVPVLAISADDDPLRNCHETVLANARHAAGHVFAGDHPVHSRGRGADYTAPLIAHFRRLESGASA